MLNISKARVLARTIVDEVTRARSLFPAIHNLHEGLGIIEEEWEEFKAEVFIHNLNKGPERDRRKQAKAELIQLAAMAIRTIIDCDL
jgi:hypothetical protein